MGSEDFFILKVVLLRSEYVVEYCMNKLHFICIMLEDLHLSNSVRGPAPADLSAKLSPRRKMPQLICRMNAIFNNIFTEAEKALRSQSWGKQKSPTLQYSTSSILCIPSISCVTVFGFLVHPCKFHPSVSFSPPYSRVRNSVRGPATANLSAKLSPRRKMPLLLCRMNAT